MIVTEQSVRIIRPIDAFYGIESEVKMCEYAGRNCYASQDKITDESYQTFIKNLIARGHETPLEFGDVVFDITTSRAVLAELTRHRLASFCVESQRYIQEAKTGDITFIRPTWHDGIGPECTEWEHQMQRVEKSYKELIGFGMKPEQAREVLPNSTACRIIMKANFREWRHIFELRCSKRAYPQMRELMTEMLKQAHEAIPVIFDDLYSEYVSETENE